MFFAFSVKEKAENKSILSLTINYRLNPGFITNLMKWKIRKMKKNILAEYKHYTEPEKKMSRFIPWKSSATRLHEKVKWILVDSCRLDIEIIHLLIRWICFVPPGSMWAFSVFEFWTPINPVCRNMGLIHNHLLYTIIISLTIKYDHH